MEFQDRMESFVIAFVHEFEARMYFYDLILQGQVDEARKLSSSYTKEVMGYIGFVGGGIGSVAPVLISAAASSSLSGTIPGIAKGMGLTQTGKKGMEWVGQKINTKLNEKKREQYANTLSDFIKLHKEDRMSLRKILISAALDIFRSYELQFVKVNNNEKWKQGIIILAKDGVHRSINYCAIHYHPPNVTHELIISKGAVYGKSKVKPFYAEPELIYEDDVGQVKWKRTALYEKSGIVTESNGKHVYHQRHDNTDKVDKYGYRRLLDSEDWTEMEKGYRLSQEKQNCFQNYTYVFNKLDDEEKTKILNKIDSDYANVTKASVKEVIEEVKVSILNEIRQLVRLHCKDENSEDTKILHRIADDIDKLDTRSLQENFERHFKEINSSIQELGVKNEALHVKTYDKVDNIDKVLSKYVNAKTLTKNERIWFNVQAPVKLFTGREKELKTLGDKICGTDESNISITVIAGLGGIGKTQLARKYIQVHVTNHYYNVIWINSENEPDLCDAFITVAKDKLGIKTVDANGEKKEINIIVEEVYEKLIQKDTFIVFDNAEKNSSFMKFLPDSGYCDKKLHILITSRYQEWGIGINVLRLNELLLEDGMKLVKNWLGIKDEFQNEDILHLLEKLQNYPLCIVQAIAYIQDQNVTGDFSIKDYLREFETNAQDFLDSDVFEDWSNVTYARTTYTTWEITTRKIESIPVVGKYAMDILNVISYLAPENIKRETFLEVAGNDEKVLKGAVRFLVKYSMVSGNDKQTILSVHRLVQLVTRLHLRRIGSEVKVIDIAHDYISNLYPIDENRNIDRNFDEVREFVPHFEVFLNRITGRIDENLEMYCNIIELMTAVYLDLGYPRRLMELLREALNIYKKHYGPEHYQVGIVLRNIGIAKKGLGEIEDQKLILEEALSIFEKHYGPDHFQVGLTLNHLGWCYGDLDDDAKGKELLERALIINENHFGPDHYHVAITLNRLGNAYGDFKNFQKQKELLERALKIKEQYFGPNHYQVARTLNDLGNAYGDLGDNMKKIELLERALEIKEKHFGADHYEVGITFYSLGNAYDKVEDLQKSAEFFEKALLIDKKHYGPDHIDVASTLYNLGKVYGKLGDTEKKVEFLEKTLLIEEKHYGPDHHQVAVTLHSLGDAYGKMDDHSKAKELLERSLIIKEKYYGPNHINIVLPLNCLANTYGKLGDMKNKIELLERALEIKEMHYGQDHYEVARTLNSVGNAYGDLGDAQKEKEILERSLMIYEKHFGPDHYKVAIPLYNLGNAYGDLGFPQKKKELLERTLIIEEKHYGPEHHEVAITLNNLGECYGDLGDIQKMKEFLERALSIREKHFTPDHYKIGLTLHGLANAYGELGDVLKKKQLLERTLLIDEKHFGSYHFEMAPEIEDLGIVYGCLGDIEKKRDLLEQALRLKEKHYGPDHYELAFPLENLGIAYGDLGDNDKKIELLQKALSIKEKHYGPSHYQLGFPLENLAVAYGDLGDIDKEIQLLQQTLTIREKHYGCNHYRLTFALENLGIAFGDLGDVQKKVTLLKQVLSIKEKHYGSDHYQLGPTLYNLAVAYDTLGDIDKRDEFLVKAFSYF